MHPNHKFQEEPFAQTSQISFVGGQLRNSESFDELMNLQSQINSLNPSGFATLSAQVATNTSNIATNTTNISSNATGISLLNTELDIANASFQLAYVNGEPLTQDSLGAVPLYVWSRTHNP
jgi:hypothetical protein